MGDRCKGILGEIVGSKHGLWDGSQIHTTHSKTVGGHNAYEVLYQGQRSMTMSLKEVVVELNIPSPFWYNKSHHYYSMETVLWSAASLI
jgi:hypothetical protein